MPLQRVISGGQTGVDQVALEVAKALGYETGGTAPKGYRTDAGPNLALRDLYGLKESWSPQYAPRTIVNVRDADAVVWFGDPSSPGGRLTLEMAEQHRKRYRVNPTPAELCDWLDQWPEHHVLNVAGNRLRTNPAATEAARAALTYALNELVPF